MDATVLVAPVGETDARIAREMAPPGFDLVYATPGTAEYAEVLRRAKYVVGTGDQRVNEAFFRAAPALKLLQLLSAGYNHCDVEAARRAGVLIANNGGANSVAVAEHAVMLMLAVSRRLIWQHSNVAAGRWRTNDWLEKHIYEVHGRRLGIVGLGTIGKKVARLARAFGMDIEYYDIVRLNEDAEDAIGARFRLLSEVLRESDIVSLHVPLNAATRHLIGAAELALMKPSAILVNTCRGPVVDEAALYEALSSGKLWGAGLDVFEQEPTAPDNPLFALENVILTPHLAGPTYDNRFKRFRNAYDNVQRMERGQRPLWVVPELSV